MQLYSRPRNSAYERVFAIIVVLIGLAVFSSFVSGVTNTVCCLSCGFGLWVGFPANVIRALETAASY